MKQGLNNKELQKFKELLIKANDTQIRSMWLEFQEHIAQRIKTTNKIEIIRK